MRKRLFMLSAAAILVLVVSSCQKEKGFQEDANGGAGGPGNGLPFTGEYNMVGIFAETYVVMEAKAAGMNMKTITTSAYRGDNCAGTVSITSDKILFNNIAYSVDTVQQYKMYMDNVLVMEDELPLTLIADPVSSVSSYVRNNADSLTINGGAILDDPTGQAPAPSTTKMGTRISWSGDTLVLRMNTKFTQAMDVQGVPATMSATMKSVLKLKKR